MTKAAYVVPRWSAKKVHVPTTVEKFSAAWRAWIAGSPILGCERIFITMGAGAFVVLGLVTILLWWLGIGSEQLLDFFLPIAGE